MSQESDLSASIEMLEKVLADCIQTDRTRKQIGQLEFLIDHLKSGQADPQLVVALRAFDGSIATQGKAGQRSTDSAEQGRAGLTARVMRLADEVFSRLAPTTHEPIGRKMSAAGADLMVGRHN